MGWKMYSDQLFIKKYQYCAVKEWMIALNYLLLVKVQIQLNFRKKLRP